MGVTGRFGTIGSLTFRLFRIHIHFLIFHINIYEYFLSQHKEIPLENTTETFGTIAKVCQRMLENP